MAGKKCIDHLGQEFSSKKSMCRYWNIDDSSYDFRIRSGWAQKDALEIPTGISNKCTDHLGQEFSSIREMCEYWKVSYHSYCSRVSKHGWAQKDALTIPTKSHYHKCIDHLGQEFSSKKSMCRYYNIPRDIYSKRIKAGWSQKDALETPYNRIVPKDGYIDHLGQKFHSASAMCKHWNINWDVYKSRVKKGWDLKDILETPTKKFSYKKSIDHLGQEFPSETAMCNYWGIILQIYQRRIEQGWGQKEALERPSIPKILNPDLSNILLLEPGFYKVIYKNQVDVWTYDELMYYYRTTNNLKITS